MKKKKEDPRWVNVGWIADSGHAAFYQWLQENPKATKREIINIAMILLKLADR